ncbi:MAG: hypothetical protein AAFV53_12240 [Myxococcota bacterium]
MSFPVLQGLRGDAVTPVVDALCLTAISVLPALYADPALHRAVGTRFAQSDIVRRS